MGRETSIGWCHHTFNGVHGCAHAVLGDDSESPGCRNCYAEQGAKRNPKTLGIWGEEGTRVLAVDNAWEQLAVWHRAALRAGELRRVFCYSIGDVFESPRGLANADVCAKGRARLWDVIERLPLAVQHCATPPIYRQRAGLIFMLLTKRPENVQRMVPPSWLVTGAPSGSCLGWHPHVWLGTSVENQQAADERIPHLLAVPGVAVPFLSVEPLLERVDIRRWLNRLGWVIAGGESGKHARSCEVPWIRDLRDQARAAGVPFLNKQLGARAIDELRDGGDPPYRMLRLPLIHPKGGDPAEWPEDLRVQEVPHA